MKFAIAKEHKDYFDKKGWIEFEDLLSDEQFLLLKDAIREVLSERTKKPYAKIIYSSETLFKQGRDLWRSHENVSKIAEARRMAETAAELFEKKALRLGFDQFFPSANPSSWPLFEQVCPIDSISCIKEIVGGFIIALENQTDENLAENMFPKKAGNILFFKGNVPIDWKFLCHQSKQPFYLVAYTLPTARYYLEMADPNTHDLKKLGYIFNDKLKDNLHPLVFRN